MSTLGKAVIEFSADTAKFQGDVGRAAVVFDKNMAAMSRVAREFMAVIGAAGVGAGLTSMVRNALDAGDELVKLSQKSGFAIERLGELKHGAALSGVDMAQLTVGLKEFNKSLTEAADPLSKAGQLFRTLGVDITKGPDIALRQFADALSRVSDPSQKSAIAVELLGKAGSDMIPWLAQGAEGMEKAAEEARKLGLVMSKETAKAAEEFNDNLQRVTSATQALGIAILNPALPALDAMAQKMLKMRMEGVTLAGTLENLARVLKLFPGMGTLLGGGIEAGLAGARSLAPDRGGPDLWKRVGNIRLNGLDAELAAGAPAAGAPNNDMLACALSGGKWVNGKCERGAAGGKPGKAEDPLEAQRRALERVGRAAEEAARDIVEFERAVAAQNLKDAEWEMAMVPPAHAEELWQDVGSGIAEAAAESERFAGAIDNAFDRAVRGGGNFVDVLKNLGEELINIEIQKRLFAPASKAFSSGLDSLFAGLFGPGGASGPSFDVAAMDVPAYATGTDYVPRTGLALVHQGEQIIPAGKSGGGIVFSPQIHIDARSDRAQVAAEVDRALRMSEARMHDNFRRGGSLARAAGTA